MFIINHRRIFYAFSGIVFIVAFYFFIIYGLHLGVDFTGGSLMEIRFKESLAEKTIQENLTKFDLGKIEIKTSLENSYILRFKEISEETHQNILRALSGAEELRFDSIGPAVGKELKKQAIVALLIASFLMLIYVYFAFRKSSYLFSSWLYGIIVIITTIFDIVVVLGVFSFLGKYYGVEIGLPFIAAILAVVGYSMNDRIIVFDRLRENLLKKGGKNFPETAGEGLNQIFERSFNVSFAVILVLLPVIFLGGESVKYFALTLALGIVVGTYVSLFLASPMLVSFYLTRKRS